jgi:hypothetical protein
MKEEPCDRCADCGSALRRAQRYCLACGARAGSRSPQLLALLAQFHGRSARVPEPAVRPVAARPASRGAALTLPPPRFAALLVAVFIGFGVLLGATAGSSVNARLAASAGPAVRLVLAPSAPASSTPSPSSSPPSSEASPPEEASPPSAPASAAPSPAPATGAPGARKAPASANGEAGAGEQPSSGSSGANGRGTGSSLPPVKHVFVIMLSDQPYAAVFGPASTAPYLSQTLERRGALLAHYDAVAHEQLADGVALLSGQGPTAETAANCPIYADIAPATVGAGQQILGNGCVYPAATRTLAGQLAAKHLSWRAYVQGMDEGSAQPSACAHPALGAPDPKAGQAPSGGGYETFRNPFVYFHSVIDSPGCASNDVGLDKLSTDLAGSPRSFSYVVPDACHDASPTPCSPGAPAGAAAADGFLKTVVPEIIHSRAYRNGGLLVITVDEAPTGGEFADSSSCCGQPRYPNLQAPATGLPARGGGAVGALLLSPFVKGATTSQEPYNHFSLLRTIEDLFSLGHLGYAGAPGVRALEPSLFTARAPH